MKEQEPFKQQKDFVAIKGNTLLSTVLFIFVLTGFVRLCFNRTLHENKLTTLFIQETQGTYILENLFQMGRDYVYRLTCDGYSPNILFSPSCFRKYTANGTINFNASFALNQIAPAGYSLSVSAPTLSGGPVFFQDARINNDDERWKSEAYLLAQLTIQSPFIPNWTLSGVQLLEIARRPLCDFQVFGEGDTAFIFNKNQQFTRPVNVNGNCRMGMTSGNILEFKKKTTIGGHFMRISDSSFFTDATFPLPNEANEPGRSGDSVYRRHGNPDSTAGVVRFNTNLANPTNPTYVDYSAGAFTSNRPIAGFSNFEQAAILRWQGALTTRSRALRPLGLDPTLYDGFWFKNPANDFERRHRILEMGCGPYCLINVEDIGYARLYSGVNSGTTNEAFASLRGLTASQTLTKLKLAESQKATYQPGLIVAIFCDTSLNASRKPLNFQEADAESFPYALYYPQEADISYSLDPKAIRLYQKVVSSGFQVIDSLWPIERVAGVATWDKDFNSQRFHQSLSNGRLLFGESGTNFPWGGCPNNGRAPGDFQFIFKTSKSESGNVGSVDSPPHNLRPAENSNPLRWENPWAERTQIDSHPIFIYDKNRRKWIQLIDFDVGELRTRLSSGNPITTAQLRNYVHFTRDWFGSASVYNWLLPNYKRYNDAAFDIREDYVNQRTNFFGVWGGGDYEYTLTPTATIGPPIGVGIRIINATELPTGGLTISASLPVYIQGNFNTVNVKAKAAIHADSVTVLSAQWQDWASAMSNESLIKPQPTSGVTINAHIVTGTPNPVYWTDELNAFGRWLGLPEAGVAGGIRILEDWGNHTITIGGSLLLPFRSKIQWEPFVPLNTNSLLWNRNLPPIFFSYNNNLQASNHMPFYCTISRGRKTQAIGSTTYDVLNGIVADDWDTGGTMATYHNTRLPNYLKQPSDL